MRQLCGRRPRRYDILSGFRRRVAALQLRIVQLVEAERTHLLDGTLKLSEFRLNVSSPHTIARKLSCDPAASSVSP
jgi:hypothetical protein